MGQQQQQAVVVFSDSFEFYPIPSHSVAKTLGERIPVQVLPQTGSKQAQGKPMITI